MTRFYTGTAGWSYLHRDKEFYPEKTAKEDKLSFYASRFNAVELNNSFYHLPPPEQFSAWEAQTPKDFRFAVKAPRYITHTKRLKDAEETAPSFLKTVAIQKKPGPLFFQLPPSLGIDTQRLEKLLKALPSDRRCAIEMRDPGWYEKDVFALLKKHKTAFVIFDTPDAISPRHLTADFAYVRLRGRDHPKLKSFLKGWKDWLSDNTKEAYVFFNHQQDKKLSYGNALLFRELTA